VHQIGPQQQIFRRIAGHGQLGADQQIGSFQASGLQSGENMVGVFFDRAHRQIELGEHQG